MNPGPRGTIPHIYLRHSAALSRRVSAAFTRRSQPAAGVSSSCSYINPLRRLHLVVILPRKNRTGSVQRTSAGDRASKTKYTPGHSAQQVKGNHGCSRSTRARIVTSKNRAATSAWSHQIVRTEGSPSSSAVALNSSRNAADASGTRPRGEADWAAKPTTAPSHEQ